MNDATRVKQATAEDGFPVDAPMTEAKKFTIQLRKAVPAHDDPKKMELSFREPSMSDVLQFGLPVEMDLSPNPVRTTQMLARLGFVAPSTIEAMDTHDWMTCAMWLARFFHPDAQLILSY